ncbi:MAG TPA: hypothetical protein VHY08_08655, partial [Bacillota bacterium]|nr:hypothetical protein [Bacillota bacterium]
MTLEYFVVQGALLCPAIYGIMLWSCYRLIRRLYKNDPSDIPFQKRHILYILFCGWLMPALFFLQSFKNEVGGHWPMAAYGVVFAGLAMELLNVYQMKNRTYKLLLRPRFLISVILWSALLVFATFNLEFLQTITNRKVNAGYGYQELAQRVEQIYRENGSNLVIATSTYGFSSFLSFYMPDYQISLLGPGDKYGRAYDTWDDWAHWTGRNLIFIS